MRVVSSAEVSMSSPITLATGSIWVNHRESADLGRPADLTAILFTIYVGIWCGLRRSPGGGAVRRRPGHPRIF
jgi:hypothetical protein